MRTSSRMRNICILAGSGGGLVAEATGAEIEQRALFGKAAALGNEGIQRIAGRRRDDDFGGLLVAGPILALVQIAEEAAVGLLIAAEAMNRTGELGEALEVTAGFEVRAVHAGREANDFRVVGAAEGDDQFLDARDDILEHAAAAIEAIDASLDEETVREHVLEKVELRVHALLRKARVHFGHEHEARQVRYDAVIGDHQRRGQHIAEMTSDAERAVVAVALDAADAQRFENKLVREARGRDLEIVHGGGKAHRAQLVGVVLGALEALERVLDGGPQLLQLDVGFRERHSRRRLHIGLLACLAADHRLSAADGINGNAVPDGGPENV